MTRRSVLSSAAAPGGVAVLTALLWWSQGRIVLPDVPILYLPVVLIASLRGALPGSIAAMASTIAIHVFFTSPRASLRVAALQDVATIVAYLAVATVTSSLLARTRRSALEASQRADVAGSLQRLAAAGLALDAPDDREAIARVIAEAVGSRACALWMAGGAGAPELWGSFGVVPRREHESSAAWVAREGKTATLAGDGGRLRFVPLRGGALALADSPDVARLLSDARFAEGLSGLVILLVSRARTARLELDAAASRRSDELKTALLSMVSHELRSPLTAIKATVGNLLRDEGDADRESLAGIESEADRLDRVVRNLLDASRIEAGQIRPATHPVRLRRMFGELADRNQLDDAELELQVAPDVMVDADPVLLGQVVQNLIENAQRHGSFPMRIAAERDDGVVRVEVRDAGPGVPDAELGRIFDRFARLNRGGVGLGLALCRAIVEAHGGRIVAANGPDGGLAVTFTLTAV